MRKVPRDNLITAGGRDGGMPMRKHGNFCGFMSRVSVMVAALHDPCSFDVLFLIGEKMKDVEIGNIKKKAKVSGLELKANQNFITKQLCHEIPQCSRICL